MPPCSEQPCTISIHAPRAGSDVQKQSCPRSGRYFNPRSPCGERQGPALGTGLQITISIHAPRAGSDKWPYHTRGCPKRFQSTLPVRGATRIISLFPIVWYGFQSTLPVRGATGKVPVTIQAHRNFNPRSPCGERLYDYRYINIPGQISIHAPRAGSDTIDLCNLLRGPNFNPRSPCGERRSTSFRAPDACSISIHAPRAGSDIADYMGIPTGVEFQSTLPVRGATTRYDPHDRIHAISIHAPRAGSDPCFYRPGDHPGISIHAPRAGSDSRIAWVGSQQIHFNPRSPCGERRQRTYQTYQRQKFQSTLPVRGATVSPRGVVPSTVISIHAPRAGSDSSALLFRSRNFIFQSTLPVRGATLPRRNTLTDSLFQSTLPVRGATLGLIAVLLGGAYFNPRSPCGERLLVTWS